jgi:hypothetical protein
MHVLHYLATEASSKTEAVDNVEETKPQWSDWHSVGGRWGNLHKGNAISYRTSPKEFIEALKDCRARRSAKVLELLEQSNMDKFNISALEYMKTGDLKINYSDLNNFYVFALTEMLLGNWCVDSGFYDTVAGCASFESLEDRIKKDGARQYLVAMDYHC